MTKNLNLKKLKAIKDSKRVEDKRSGGSGSLRSSIFNRQDEALPKETIKEFEQKFWEAADIKVGGGNMPGTNGKKHVCGVALKLPEKVVLGNKVEALLVNKMDYDKNTKTFKAYYRPKNGRWGQVQNVEEEF